MIRRRNMFSSWPGRLTRLLIAALTSILMPQVGAAADHDDTDVLIGLSGTLEAKFTAWDDGGSLQWQDRYPGGIDTTARVAVEDTRVFVAGKGPAVAGGSPGWLVKAYDTETGDVLWHDLFTGLDGNSSKAQTVTASNGRVFVGGFANTVPGRVVAMIRVYDGESGGIEWEDRIDYGSFFASVTWVTSGNDDGKDQRPSDEDGTRPRRLYASGRGFRPDFKTVWFVRAYDANTGNLLWQDTLDGGGFDDALSVVSDGPRVFASGFTTDASALVRHFTVRAYDAETGTLLWEDRVPNGIPRFFAGDAASQVAVSGDRVVAGGVISDATGFHFAVRTYDAETGVLLWNDLVNKGAGADEAESVALSRGQAYVSGFGGAACSLDVPSDCDWLIRAYDVASGALIWEKQLDFHHQDDNAPVVLACGDRVIVGGLAGTDSVNGFGDWSVQVLDAKDGEPVWKDLLSTLNSAGLPVGLGVAGNRLFATGAAVDPATQNGDYIVRAYAFGFEGNACEAVANNSGLR